MFDAAKAKSHGMALSGERPLVEPHLFRLQRPLRRGRIRMAGRVSHPPPISKPSAPHATLNARILNEIRINSIDGQNPDTVAAREKVSKYPHTLDTVKA